MIGVWEGVYMYENKKVQKLIGYDKTKFTLTIDFFEKDLIKGFVLDDKRSGGMSGKGEIEGEICEDAIYFEKRMPFESIITDVKGTRKTSDKKHKPIFYEGKLIDENVYQGTWEFEKVWDFVFGIIPVRYKPGNGTWEMKKVR